MHKHKTIRYSLEKNEILKEQRSISFEDVILSIEDDISIFLKTIIPSRKMNKKYNKGV